MTKFIKHAQNERVECQVSITIKAVRIESELSTGTGSGSSYILQILRGPILKETKEFELPVKGPAIVPIDLVFSRVSTFYKVGTKATAFM